LLLYAVSQFTFCHIPVNAVQVAVFCYASLLIVVGLSFLFTHFLFTPAFSGTPLRPKEGLGVSRIKQTAVM